jgi:hypothetical protein
VALLESHAVALILFSGLTSTVLGALAEETVAARARYAAKAFAGFMVAALIGAWVMRLIN